MQPCGTAAAPSTAVTHCRLLRSEVALQAKKDQIYYFVCFNLSVCLHLFRFVFGFTLMNISFSCQGVCLVISATSNSALLQTLAKRKKTFLFSLCQLTMADRKEIVQKGLDAFGKKLSDSAFNNQVPPRCSPHRSVNDSDI